MPIAKACLRSAGASLSAHNPPARVSEFPVLIVNQARVIDYFAEYAENGPAKIKPDYGYEFLDLEIEESGEYPVKVRLRDPVVRAERHELLVDEGSFSELDAFVTHRATDFGLDEQHHLGDGVSDRYRPRLCENSPCLTVRIV